MANINLAPGTKYLALVRKRRMRIFMLCGFLVVAMFLIWGGLFLVNSDLQNKNESLSKEIDDVEVAIARLGEDGDRVISFQNRLEAVDGLLDQHVSWDPILNELERLLPEPTIVDSITADVDNGSISVEGYTTDIDMVAQTLASLNNSANHNTIFTQGSFGGVSKENIGEGEDTTSRVKFQVSFSFDKTIFSNNQ